MGLAWDASLTDAGVSMISQWAQGAGDRLTITKAVIGEGIVAASQLHLLTQLTDEKTTISIQGSESVANGVKLKLKKTSQGITTSFTLNQIGVYAKLDTSGGTPIIAETLIGVYQQNPGVLIPTEADAPDFAFTFYGTIQTNYSGDLTINVDTSALLSQDDIADDLVTADATMALSANMGRLLADNLAANENVYGAKNRNIYPYEETTKTENGLTFTDNGDGTITVSAASYPYTVPTNTYFICNNFLKQLNLEQGNYILSGSPIVSDDIYVVFVYYDNGYNEVYNKGTDRPFYLPLKTNNETLRIFFGANSVITEALLFKPMIRDGQIIDPTFVPYAKTNQQLTKDVSGVSNRNLVDNGWFTVNQRGATTVTSNGDYGADRWKKTGGTSLTFSSSGVTFNNGQIAQDLDNQIPNGTYTASIKYSDGSIESGTVAKNNDTDILSFIDRTGLTLGYVPSSQTFYMYSGGAVTVRALKLEVGSVSTLHLDVEPDYITELLKCQRYLAPAGWCVVTKNSYNLYTGTVKLPVPLRGTPTIPTPTLTDALWCPGVGYFTPDSVSTNVRDSYKTIINFTFAGSALTEPSYVYDNGVLVSAEP